MSSDRLTNDAKYLIGLRAFLKPVNVLVDQPIRIKRFQKFKCNTIFSKRTPYVNAYICVIRKSSDLVIIRLNVDRWLGIFLTSFISVFLTVNYCNSSYFNSYVFEVKIMFLIHVMITLYLLNHSSEFLIHLECFILKTNRSLQAI